MDAEILWRKELIARLQAPKNVLIKKSAREQEAIDTVDGQYQTLEDFEGNSFAIQLVAKGSYVDNGVGNGKSYLVEAHVIRLNHVALNSWLSSIAISSPDAFNSQTEWEAHEAKYKARQETWRTKIIDTLGLDESAGGICITQAQSEVFTVVCISELLARAENLNQEEGRNYRRLN